MHCKAYGWSVVGGREMNQDAFLIREERCLFAVADGVGGGLKGEVASKMAVDGLDAHLHPGATLKEVFHRLQNDVYQDSMKNFGEALMGTTLTAALVEEGTLRIGHVGDSRLYIYSGGALRLMTEDQEYYDEKIQGTILASYLGVPPEVHGLKIVEESVPVNVGDKLLLCSDGLYRQMNEPRIAAMLKEHSANPEEMVKLLCHEASTQSHSDNVTVVYVEVLA